MELDSARIASVVQDAISHLACELPEDVSAGLAHAREVEDQPLSSYALDLLCANDAVSRYEHVPICQDTGTVWICLEVGPDIVIDGNVFSEVDNAVANAYNSCALRKSLVADALLDRTNTGDNTPAFCEMKFSTEPGARLHIMLKGGGSDNASRVCMLPPGSGKKGIIEEVVACVREKGANACPPLIIGIGIGATFDKVGSLAKHALMRPIGTPAPSEELASFESELLDAVNSTCVGAGGMGGSNTALAVHVNTAPCHIAALPLAINLGCCALRRTTIELEPEDPAMIPLSTGKCASFAALLNEPTFEALSPKHIQLPLLKADAARMRVGEAYLLSGELYTLRDAGHVRLLDEMDVDGKLPYGLEGQIIFYAGPTPPLCGRPFGAVGPTTSSRMDFAAPLLYRAGLRATIGKGRRSEDVRLACAAAESIYFCAVGGAAAYLARCVTESTVVAYDDLGTEALRRINVKDFPVIVAFDAKGDSLYG